MEELLGQSEQRLAKIICKTLKERPHRAAKKSDVVKFVCKRYGVITRGAPRARLERKIDRALNYLIKEGLVEEYRSKTFVSALLADNENQRKKWRSFWCRRIERVL